MKKIRRYFLFGKCTINKDSWHIRRKRHKFLSFWILFCPFIPLNSTHFTFVYHEWQSYNVWFLRYGVQQAKSFLILDHFLLFYWKIKILKKKPGDIISLHLCTINDNHMMYGSLDIRCNRQNFLWTILCSFKLPLSPLPHP